MKIRDETPSFDFEQQPGPPEQLPTHNAPSVRLPGRDGTEESGPPSLAPESTWHEVPQARFLSWSRGMQFVYCAKRDEDSAQYADTETERQFYLARARTYRSL